MSTVADCCVQSQTESNSCRHSTANPMLLALAQNRPSDRKSVPRWRVLASRLLLKQSRPQSSDMLLDKLDKFYKLLSNTQLPCKSI
jgi:hypothetical protein